MELTMEGYYTAKHLAERLGINASRVRQYAEEYELLTGRLLRGAENGAWVFPPNVVLIISEAHRLIDTFGSFRRALEFVFNDKYHGPPPTSTAELAHEALAIRSEGVRYSRLMQDVFELLLGKMKIHEAAIDLERRQSVQVMEDAVAALAKIRRAVAAQEDLARQASNLVAHLRNDLSELARARMELAKSNVLRPIQFWRFKVSVETTKIVLYTVSVLLAMTWLALLRLISFHH
jgi:DNA-binding transcriptional MerR regulator